MAKLHVTYQPEHLVISIGDIHEVALDVCEEGPNTGPDQEEHEALCDRTVTKAIRGILDDELVILEHLQNGKKRDSVLVAREQIDEAIDRVLLEEPGFGDRVLKLFGRKKKRVIRIWSWSSRHDEDRSAT